MGKPPKIPTPGTAPHMPRNLLTDPCWTPEDLGLPLPESDHATSVALPCWEHVVGYEEGRPEVIQALRLGYPRFVLHPQVASLFSTIERETGQPGERCFAFPSQRAADRCVAFLNARGWRAVRGVDWGATGIHAVFFPEAAFKDAKAFWQHFGKIISSRRAEAALAGRAATPEGETAKARIREQIAGLTGESPDNVWLFPSGMAALGRALKMAQAVKPEAKSIQMGFPYVDVFKIQTVEGPGTHFIPDYSLETLHKNLEAGPASSIICEFPGNPLLQGCDLVALSAVATRHGTPLIVDDTAATYANVQVFPYADMIVTSLTKAFSGVGDVMAGALVVRGSSPFAEVFSNHMVAHFEDLLWGEDAVVLERNARDFESRVCRMNTTAETLCGWLSEHPLVERVYYPKYMMRAAYDRVLRSGGGYGGLFSITLKEGAQNAPRFYDRLRVSKGPSLGNEFTLACPYTLLAHFEELDWAEAHGVSRYLIRVSVGLESADELVARFSAALEGLKH